MKLLSSSQSLHDVRDLEAIARTILDRKLRQLNVHFLPFHEYEDLLTELIEEGWVMSLRYESREGGLSFSTFLNRYLAPRVVDWYRRRFGDSRYGDPPELVPFDALLMDSTPFAAQRETLTEEPQTYEEVETRVSFGYIRNRVTDVATSSLGDAESERWSSRPKEKMNVRAVAG